MMRADYPRVGMVTDPEEDPRESETTVNSTALPYGLLLGMTQGTGPDTATRTRSARVALKAARRFLQANRVSPDDSRGLTGLLRQAIKEANAELYGLAREQTDLQYGCASLLLVLVAPGRAFVGHLGDCRLYLVRRGAASRITRDHTMAQTWVDHGILSDEQIRERPDARKPLKMLGARPECEPDIRSIPVQMEKGDALVLASSAIHENVDDDELAGMASCMDPELGAQQLVDVTRNRARGAESRILVYHSGPPSRGGQPRALRARRLRSKRRVSGWLLAVAGVALALALGLALYGLRNGAFQVPRELTIRSVPSPAAPSSEPVPPDVQPQDEGTFEGVETPSQAQVDSPTGVAGAYHEETEVASGPRSGGDRATGAAAATGGDHKQKQDPTQKADPTQKLEPSAAGTGAAGAGGAPSQDSPAAVSADAATGGDARAPVADSGADPKEAGAPSGAQSLAKKSATVSWPRPPRVEEPSVFPFSEPILDGLDACIPRSLSRQEAQRVKDLRILVNKGYKELRKVSPDPARAGMYVLQAAKVLAGSSPAVKARCTVAVELLKATVKVKYLRFVWASSSRALSNIREKDWSCARAHDRAVDARKFGATEEELKLALRICANWEAAKPEN